MNRSLLALIPTTAILIALTASAAQDTPLRYVRAKDSGASLYNLADKSSIVIGSVPATTLLEVYDERAGYLAVDAPAGMEVWVFGEFLKTTPVPGTVEVTGSAVYMRPLPRSDETSYPLEHRLHKGDRVRVIGRDDPKKPLAQDWVRIATPPGTRAWVQASDTAAVDSKEDVRAAWATAAKSGRSARPVYDVNAAPAEVKPFEPNKPGDAAKATGAAAGGTVLAGAPADESYAGAEKLYEAARTNPNADWIAVRKAYQRYLEKNPSGTMAAQANLRLQQIDAHEEIQRIKNDRTLRDSQRGDRLADAERRLREANLSQDPLWGRFQARGWLVREPDIAGTPPRFVVYWAGQPSAEIVCSSGRYDLSKFDQFEVGVQGTVLRSAVTGTETVAARPGRIDAARIEVLSARAAR